MTSPQKYLSEAKLFELLKDIVFDQDFTPMSQDTYNETAVIAAITKTKLVPQLAMAAVNMSCIGYGNRRYGLYKYKDQIIDIAELLQKAGVKINQAKDAKLKDEDLTPQRLCRAFRYHIKRYINENNFETYLFRKYSDHNPVYKDICFRGSEYLDDLTPEQCGYLLSVYQKLDAERQINITERVKRVFQAKGYIKRTVDPQ
jgi:hypothetical protein